MKDYKNRATEVEDPSPDALTITAAAIGICVIVFFLFFADVIIGG